MMTMYFDEFWSIEMVKKLYLEMKNAFLDGFSTVSFSNAAKKEPYDQGVMLHCTMCSLYSFFSIRPSEVRHVIKFHGYIAIKHIFIPARSVEWKIEKIGFSWFSNSKLVIFPQIFPCSCYRAIKYSPVVTTGFLHFMPRSLCKYKGIWLYPCINYRAIRYCPVVATGHFLLQGYMTVQRAHCAM